MTIPTLIDFTEKPDHLSYKDAGHELRMYPTQFGYTVILYNPDKTIYDKDSTHCHTWHNSLMAYRDARKIYIRMIEQYDERLHRQSTQLSDQEEK